MLRTDFRTGAADRAVFERYLTRREEKQLLATIARHAGLYAKRDHAWIRLVRYTGLRLGNLRGLTLGEARHAVAHQQLRASDECAKGGHGYDVPLNHKALQALRDLISVRRAMRQVDDDAAPLICSRRGTGLSDRSFQHRLQVWREVAGLPVEASPHWLRHTYAQRVMEMTEAKDPQGVVQVLLGHVSRNSTVKYTLPNREAVAEAAQAGAL